MKITIEVTSPSEAEVAIETLSTYRDASVSASAQTAPKEKPAPKQAKEKPAQKPAKEKPAPKPAKDEAPEENDEITLKELTAIAKDAVSRTDRDTVKNVISKYGAKLSAVDEGDYADLATELKDL